ncbi:MAG: hypothetical protein COX49_03150 [bacterium (Candidatus Stahlbacteria) CG23_combo_of_CG06-09_8_20_14_all_40_9]|nr:MAG: hypothetical protein COX49_03150 [bacterium (Candidatus Stahlbacteria) CG23_combo_of_CG06-09_8_20_14_all_40_9]
MKKLFRKCGKTVILLFVVIKAVFIYRVCGIDYLSNYISRLPKQVVRNILIRFGAKIGEKTNISTAIIIDNAVTKDYTHLIIGDRCYIGKNVFFDLVEPVIVEDEGVISARVTFLTHSDPGERLLRKYFKRETGKIRIGKGTWIGACATIMPGVTIGECAVIGANALVNKDIPPYSVAVGVPARVIRKIHE